MPAPDENSRFDPVYSDEHLTREMLRASEERFRSIMESSRDVIYRVNLQTGQFDFISPSCEQIVGYTAEELMALDAGTAIQMIHPDDREVMRTALAQLATTNTVEVEYRQRAKNGEYHWISNRLSVTRDDSGHSVYRTGNIRDITEHRRAEAEQQRLIAAIQQERDRLSALINSVTDEIWFADADLNVALVNRAVSKEFDKGIEDAKQIETIAASLEVYRGDGTPRPVTESPLLRASRGETVINEEEILRIPASGELRYRQVNAAPVRGLDGAIIGAVSVVRDVTERKQAEEAITQNNQRISGILSSIRDDFYVLDRDWKFVYANKQFAGRIGKEPEDFVGKCIWEMFPKHVGSTLYENFHASMEKGEIRRFEVGGQYTDAWYSMTSFPSAEGITVLGSDITERKRADEALKKAYNDLIDEQNRLLAVMEALPVGVAILDEKGGNVQSNHAFEEVWGNQRPEAQSIDDYAAYQAWWMDTGEPVKPEEWASAQAIQKGETVVDQQMEIQRFDGSRGYILNSGAPIRDAQGRIIGSAVAIMDITKIIEAENALRVSQERFQVAVNTAPILVYSCDREQRYTWIYNPLRGFHAEDVLGKRDDEVLPPQAAVELIAAKQKALDSGEGGVQEVKVPLNGEDTFYILTTDPIRDPQGNVTGLTCSAIDITEQKCLQAQQQEQAIQIEVQRRLMDQREQDRQAMARDLHDGPIQTLSSSMFHLYMVKEAFPDPKLQEELDLLGSDIKNTIHELRDLLNDLRPPALMQFGLLKVTKMFIEDFRSQYPGIEIDVDLEVDDKCLSNDAHLTLYRIFQAGMNNIIRHSEATKVWVAFKIEQENFVLTLRDNGKGFEVRTDLTQLTRTGHFGLVGMKERAEAIQGELHFYSSPGQGTTIEVKLPLNNH